jgi:hypothetical protein
MGKIDVWDLDISIANYIYKGIKGYIKENEKATFPTAPDYDGIDVDDLETRVKRWHEELNEIAKKFLRLTKRINENISDEEIAGAFDSLKEAFRLLWI